MHATITLWKMFPKVSKHEHQCRTWRSSRFFVATRDHISSGTQHKRVLLPLKYILWEEFWSLLSMFSVRQEEFFSHDQSCYQKQFIVVLWSHTTHPLKKNSVVCMQVGWCGRFLLLIHRYTFQLIKKNFFSHDLSCHQKQFTFSWSVIS